MNRRSRLHIDLLPLAAALISFSVSSSASFANEITPQEKYDRILLANPTPQITPATWKTMWPAINNSWSPLEAIVLITVEKGAIKSVTTKQSTGFKAADDEIADWIRTKWRFRPGTTRTITMPIYLNATRALLRGGETLTRPLTLTKRDLGKDVTISTERLLISIEVVQEQITKIRILKSTRDSKLDAAAVRWVRANWTSSSKNGISLIPIIFSRKE
jgi:hypothetical protein